MTYTPVSHTLQGIVPDTGGAVGTNETDPNAPNNEHSIHYSYIHITAKNAMDLEFHLIFRLLILVEDLLWGSQSQQSPWEDLPSVNYIHDK